jgi:hypothetical protein
MSRRLRQARQAVQFQAPMMCKDERAQNVSAAKVPGIFGSAARLLPTRLKGHKKAKENLGTYRLIGQVR